MKIVTEVSAPGTIDAATCLAAKVIAVPERVPQRYIWEGGLPVRMAGQYVLAPGLKTLGAVWPLT